MYSLCAAFFATHLERLNGIELYCSKKAGVVTMDDQYKRVPGPEHIRYEIMKCTAPSWIEEQRVLRALWRIIIYFDVQTIVGLRADPNSALSELLAKQGPRSIWFGKWLFGEELKPTLHPWEIQEIDTVFVFLGEGSEKAPMPVVQKSGLRKLPLIEPGSFTVPQTPPVADTVAAQWQQLPSDLQRAGPGYQYLRSQQKQLSYLADVDGYGMWRPVNNEDFNPLRTFGMCIWDNEKLARLGLARLDGMPREIYESYLSGLHRSQPNFCELSIRWRSFMILSRRDRSG